MKLMYDERNMTLNVHIIQARNLCVNYDSAAEPFVEVYLSGKLYVEFMQVILFLAFQTLFSSH